ncbi:6-phosphogluconate dehydrogenase [Candidatus Carsonella ruddii PV]|uniref:6-phosphogluconate dehydrogenase n=1 Tax=Carsonella ruddii (strain PV) TaxID=387662 RepID=Q05FV1_CARRP|nr:NAD(P)-binding domain-containing protein [Candidatus Carsonella ruddii]BAF35070.1 6-phosphogluconate dehydrogenase [Candidatus Carsonella ruddii PV]
MLINHIGIIGFGSMGKNISLNLIKKKIFLSVYNREKIYLNKKFFNIKIITNNLKKFINSFSNYKIIIILIKPGLPVKNILFLIKDKLNISDILIDFGNSYFKNTYFNFLNIKKKFSFISAGISGGSEGALRGLCLMIDGNFLTIKRLLFFFNIISLNIYSRCSYSISIGIGSAHYLKMIHNAIEYGILQIISEIYFFLKIILKKKKKIINIINIWNKTELNSYLIKILINILIKKSIKILDKIDQKGTGSWSVISSIKNYININSIFEALIIRIISNNIYIRNLINKSNNFFIKSNISILIFKVKKTFFFCIFFCYLQGFNQIIKIKKKYNWHYNYNNVFKSYLDSCIINSSIIYYLLNFKKNFFLINKFLILIKKNINYYKEFFLLIINCEIISFTMFSCFNFINIIINKNYNFKYIQLQRNYFGNHLLKFL